VLACVVIVTHLGVPALSTAATAPDAARPSPKLLKSIRVASPSAASTKQPGVQITPHPTDWTETVAPSPAIVTPVAPGPPITLDRANLPPGVTYATITHRSISDVVIHRSDCDADGYLKNELLLTDGITSASSEGTPADRYMQAAVDEDGGINFFRHFYNPINNQGLSDLTPSTWGNSMEWAWDGHDQDWRVAREAFYQAVTQSSKDARATQMSRAFYALGHVVHLVEDLGQPQHTRNDAHASSAYEDYCAANFNTAGAVAGLGSPAPPVFTATTSPFSRIPPEFASFWDTGQYTGQAGFSGFTSTPGLAEFSNAYFITDDTMFGSIRTVLLPRTSAPPLQVTMRTALDNRSTAAHHQFPFPNLRNTDLADWFPASITSTRLQREGEGLSGAVRYVSYTLGGVTIPALFLINNSSFPFNYDHEIGFDDVTNLAAAQILIPKANAYATGITNLFFRGKIGLDDPTTSWDAGSQTNQMVVHNTSTADFGPGTWSLYYDDENGNRSAVSGFDASGYGGGMSAGGTFTAKFPELLCDGGHEFTLVFRGKIGNEVDAVAAKTFYPADELWVGTYIVPSADPLCYGVSDLVYAIIHRPTPEGYNIVGWLEFANASDLFPVSGTCGGGTLQLGNNPQCGWLLSGTVSGSTLTDGQTCCWYCPLNPPPSGAFVCGSVVGMQREE
jgi:hypothetical protein